MAAAELAPKGNGILTLDGSGRALVRELHNPHPEITLQALFGRLHYEGYAEPEQVWQSTGGTDDFEPKLSLTPLIIGTLKGTMYALAFAVPLALFSALYAGDEVSLTAGEFRILLPLAQRPGRVLSRREIIDQALDSAVDGFSRTIDVHLAAIRRKPGAGGRFIETVRSVGYRLVEGEPVRSSGTR